MSTGQTFGENKYCSIVILYNKINPRQITYLCAKNKQNPNYKSVDRRVEFQGQECVLFFLWKLTPEIGDGYISYTLWMARNRDSLKFLLICKGHGRICVTSTTLPAYNAAVADPDICSWAPYLFILTQWVSPSLSNFTG